MAARGEGEQVKAYLEKHRISSLFEDLMSKVVKDLPPDPVEYLISKLQILSRRKKTASSRPSPMTTPTSRSKMQVTGTAVTSKGPGVDRPARSPGNVRPSASEGGSKGGHGSTSAHSLPGRPHRPTTVATPTRKATTTGKPKTTPPTESRRPVTAPTKTKSTSSPGRPAPTGPGRVAGKATPTSSDKAALSASKTRPRGVSKAKPTTKQTKSAAPVSKAVPRPGEELSDFFGEAKKTSGGEIHSTSDDEEFFASGQRGVEEGGDEEEETVGAVQRVTMEIDLEELLRKRHSSKQPKKSHQKLLQDLITDTSPTSSGYMSEEDESEGEEEVEMVEDYAALEEEGVSTMRRGKYAKREGPSSEGATVDLKVLICARCAKVMSNGEPVSDSDITQVTQSGGDFDSASQVGSHVSFPLWEAGSAVGSELSAVQKWSLPSSRSGDATSDVTVKSHDTWGGLAPKQCPQPLPSDTESEVQLPPPPPLEGRPWVQQEEPHHDPHGWTQEGSQ